MIIYNIFKNLRDLIKKYIIKRTQLKNNSLEIYLKSSKIVQELIK